MPRSVAIVTPTFPPYRGGIGKLAELDARQLAELGLDVHVFTPVPRGDTETETSGYELHYLFPSFRYGNAAFVPQAARLLQRFPTVLLHYPFFGAAEPLWFASKLGAKGRLLIEYHMDVVGAGTLGTAFAAHTRWWMPSIIKRAERILVTSNDYAASGVLAQLHASEPERFREMPPAVDGERFRPAPKNPALLARYKLSPSDRIAVFVGGLDKAHYFKGVPAILGALATRELRGVKAVIVGDGDMRPEYAHLAAEYGIANNVIFTGSVSDEALADHYRLGDVFVFPSIDRSEAFGIAALEAMACGLPVISSDLPGVRTIVREGETGMRVHPGSASALAQRLRQLFDDPALRKRLGEKAREVAEREYAVPARLARWEKLVAELRI